MNNNKASKRYYRLGLKGIGIEKACENCCKTFVALNRRIKHCSEKCQKEYVNKKGKAMREKALMDGITDSLYLRLRFEVFKRDNFRCQYCGRGVADGATLETDHIIPKNKGGKLSSENLITACHECNQGKRDILLSERVLKKTRPSQATDANLPIVETVSKTELPKKRHRRNKAEDKSKCKWKCTQTRCGWVGDNPSRGLAGNSKGKYYCMACGHEVVRNTEKDLTIQS